MSGRPAEGESKYPEPPLSFFACPNPDCADFNRFNAGNVSVAERRGKGKAIRRLYCHTCPHRFSEREGSLMADTKRCAPAVVRIVKCLAPGCSVEAAADICEVDPRTVPRMLEKGGRRSEDFHRLPLERLEHPPEVGEVDEVHTHAADDGPQKGGLGRRVCGVLRGVTRRWRSRAGLSSICGSAPGRWRRPSS